jgi:hypothetical protein
MTGAPADPDTSGIYFICGRASRLRRRGRARASRYSAMWDCTPEFLDGGRTQRFAPRRHGLPVPYRDVLRYWRDDETFRSFFISLLGSAPFAAYRWETPPVSMSTAAREFEFVLLDAPCLDRTPDTEAFAEQFRLAPRDRQAIAFANLGNDAVLVVPCPSGPASAYVHLAAFVRQAPQVQAHDFWRVVGEAMEARLSADPTWLSTAGMGISWLHVRLDSRPKYYGYAPYREAG